MTYSKSLIGLVVFVAASGPAFGQPPIVVEGMPTAIVSYSDLDLSSPAGQDALNGRVRRAAQSLCDNGGLRGISPEFERRACMTFALNHARGQIDRAIAMSGSPQLARRETITVAGR